MKLRNKNLKIILILSFIVTISGCDNDINTVSYMGCKWVIPHYMEEVPINPEINIGGVLTKYQTKYSDDVPFYKVIKLYNPNEFNLDELLLGLKIVNETSLKDYRVIEFDYLEPGLSASAKVILVTQDGFWMAFVAFTRDEVLQIVGSCEIEK